jgi:hypothetical protein
MPSERKLNVSLSMKINGESTSVKVLPWDPFATFNVAVLIHSFVLKSDFFMNIIHMQK